MKNFIFTALLAAAALSGCENYRTEWNPPPEGDRPFNGILILSQMEQENVAAICQMILQDSEPTGNNLGCAIWDGNGSCIIFMINKTHKGVTPAAVFRHENGHCVLHDWHD